MPQEQYSRLDFRNLWMIGFFLMQKFYQGKPQGSSSFEHQTGLFLPVNLMSNAIPSESFLFLYCGCAKQSFWYHFAMFVCPSVCQLLDICPSTLHNCIACQIMLLQLLFVPKRTFCDLTFLNVSCHSESQARYSWKSHCGWTPKHDVDYARPPNILFHCAGGNFSPEPRDGFEQNFYTRLPCGH